MTRVEPEHRGRGITRHHSSRLLLGWRLLILGGLAALALALCRRFLRLSAACLSLTLRHLLFLLALAGLALAGTVLAGLVPAGRLLHLLGSPSTYTKAK